MRLYLKMWHKKLSAFIREKQEAEETIKKVNSTGLKLGDSVIYDNEIYKIKEIWIAGDFISIELDDPSKEDYMIPLDQIKYGKEIELLYGQ